MKHLIFIIGMFSFGLYLYDLWISGNNSLNLLITGLFLVLMSINMTIQEIMKDIIKSINKFSELLNILMLDRIGEVKITKNGKGKYVIDKIKDNDKIKKNKLSKMKKNSKKTKPSN